MASVLLLSKHGEGLDLGNRLAYERHLVKFWSPETFNVASTNPSRVGKIAMLDQYDFILNCHPANGTLCEEIKQRKPVIGGNAFSEACMDQEYKSKVIKTFTSIELCDFQPGWQDIFERLYEIKTEGWFDGEEFLCYTHSLQHLRLMEGEKGPLTDGMGSVVWVSEGDRLIEQTLLPLQDILKRSNYLGPVSVTTCVTDDRIIFIDLEPFLSYNTIEAMTELMPKGLFEFMLQIIQHEKPQMKPDYSISVMLSVPCYPYYFQPETDMIQGFSYPKEAEHHIFTMPVCLKGIIGFITARSDNIRELRRRAYRTAKNCIQSPEIQFRRDIGSDADEIIGDLKAMGWLNA